MDPMCGRWLGIISHLVMPGTKTEDDCGGRCTADDLKLACRKRSASGSGGLDFSARFCFNAMGRTSDRCSELHKVVLWFRALLYSIALQHPLVSCGVLAWTKGSRFNNSDVLMGRMHWRSLAAWQAIQVWHCGARSRRPTVGGAEGMRR